MAMFEKEQRQLFGIPIQEMVLHGAPELTWRVDGQRFEMNKKRLVPRGVIYLQKSRGDGTRFSFLSCSEKNSGLGVWIF